jgi:hypothetical protein
MSGQHISKSQHRPQLKYGGSKLEEVHYYPNFFAKPEYWLKLQS